MKLLLASTFANVADKLLELVADKPENITVAFIATAADVYENKSFVDLDRNKLKEMGFKIKEISLQSKNADELKREVSGCGVIFVAGGNTFYLLQEVRKSGFDTVITDLVDTDTVYVGSSAGSVLVAPDIGLVSTFDDPADAPELKDYKGLDLVDYVVLPHYGNPKYELQYQDVIEKGKTLGIKTKTLRDDEFIIV